MRDNETILKGIPAFPQPVIATLYKTSGSSFRKPFAKALFHTKGHLGLISGGCLEDDLQMKAMEAWKQRKAKVVCYDKATLEDPIFGFATGCLGELFILLEPLNTEGSKVFLQSLEQSQHKTTHMLTILDKNSGNTVKKAFLQEENLKQELQESLSISWKGYLEKIAASLHSPEKIFEDETLLIIHDTLRPPPKVALFGAGQDSWALAEQLKLVGFSPCAFDFKPLKLEDAPSSLFIEKRLLKEGNIDFERHSAAVIMTHNINRDTDIFRVCLKKKFPYIGLLGPKYRGQKIIESVGAQESLDSVYFPTGLDLGGSSVESMALSVAAEMFRVLNGRSGESLRQKVGSIHS